MRRAFSNDIHTHHHHHHHHHHRQHLSSVASTSTSSPSPLPAPPQRHHHQHRHVRVYVGAGRAVTTPTAADIFDVDAQVRGSLMHFTRASGDGYNTLCSDMPRLHEHVFMYARTHAHAHARSVYNLELLVGHVRDVSCLCTAQTRQDVLERG